MRGPVTADFVKDMARLSGFDFSDERCQALAGELEWLLGEAERIDELGLSAEEGILTFQPLRYLSPIGDEESEGNDG
jgi:Asp-tRNA(Asn)/Glu-tRNA(Gln) amidotransferase C subunit